VKRIESYRLKDDASEQPRKLLLPLSGGISSLVLLQILDRQLSRQRIKRGRNAYELLVLMVETPSLDNERSHSECFEDLKHNFQYHTFSLLSLSSVLELDQNIFKDFASLGTIDPTNAQACLETLLSAARTASTRADLFDTLRTRLIVAFAKLNNCDAVLWGHSNSRLAAKVLAAVAEGRGGSLPFHLLDGLSPWGVHFYYPVRDLFKPELIAYAKLFPDTLYELVVQEPLNAKPPKAIRDTSINDLLAEYINSQGEKYPSIMANVVRTASKLQSPAIPTEDLKCSVCAMPTRVEDSRRMQAESGDERSHLCLPCQRSSLEMRCRENR
jgi:cytoplasmic tRNA 2-thiolation protein 2